MAWIRSEQSLLRHPKTVFLKTLLGVEIATVIGRLHMLWWWCLDYAIDGDLRKQDPEIIENCCQIPLSKLIRAGFVDRLPYRRIHSWYEIQGNYLRVRFKDQPDKWKRIKEMYENDLPISLHRGNGEGNNPRNNPRSTEDVRTYGRTDVRTDVTTKGNGGATDAAPLGGASPTRENGREDMTPEEMKAIRIKHLGTRK